MADIFAPMAGATVNVDVAAATANVQVMPTGTSGLYQVCLMNAGTATAWVRFGDNTVTATLAGGFPIGPNQIGLISVTGTHMAAIAAGATGKVYATPGAGG